MIDLTALALILVITMICVLLSMVFVAAIIGGVVEVVMSDFGDDK